MSLPLRALAASLILAACSHPSAAPPDAAEAGAPDAGIDAAGAPGVLSAPASVDLGEVVVLAPDGPTTATVTLRNRGAQSLFLQRYVVRGAGFSLGDGTCSALAPGASCDVTVHLAGARLGAALGALRVESNVGTVEVVLTARVLGRIAVAKDGDGDGHLRIAGGADCGEGCAATSAAPVAFTASAEPGSRFAGWSWPGCGADPTCVVAPGLAPARVRAIFVRPDQAVIRFELGGDAPAEGAIATSDGTRRGCEAPCALPFPTATALTVGASTPATPAGLRGACNVGDPTCTIAPTADVTVTIDARRDPSEELSVRLPWTAWRAVVDRHDQIAVTTGDALIALAPDGTPRWGLRSFGSFVGVSADDHLYAATTSGISRVRADGAIEWSIDPVRYGQPVAVAADGSLALVTSTGLNVFDAGGALRWHADHVDYDQLQTAAFDRAGTLWIERRDLGGAVGFDRYAPGGAPLAPYEPGIASPDGWTPIAFDVDAAQGPLMTWSDGTQQILRRGGEAGFELDAPARYVPPAGVVVASDESVWWCLRARGGMRLDHLAPDGTPARSLERPLVQIDPFPVSGPQPSTVARGRDGGAIVVGSYQGVAGAAGFVQAFAP